jgi:transcriptional regulator with XRE-family HTH domain
VSSRTYVSALERGIKQPTLTKVSELAGVLGVHPLTLLTLSHCSTFSTAEATKLLTRTLNEIEAISQLEP